MDVVNLKDDIDYLNKTTLVEIKQLISAIVSEIRSMADEFEGITITIKPLRRKDEKVNSFSDNVRASLDSWAKSDNRL